MKTNRWTMAGAALVLAGLAVMGTMAGFGAHPAAAGDPTPTVAATCVVGQTCTTATGTVVRIKTHTPTITVTSVATNTPVPTNTSVPNTAVPPTRAPTGGNEGVGVRPPNTGTGGASSGNDSVWVMGLGALLVAGGASALAFGWRRR